MTWPGPESYKFCPLCGGGLTERLLKEGEPKRLVCAACGFIFYIDPKLAVLALVPYQGGLVMVRRAQAETAPAAATTAGNSDGGMA